MKFTLDQKNLVEAMPVQQVVASYLLDRYDHWRDQLCKHAGMPYWQAYDAWKRTEVEFKHIRKDPAEGYPLTSLLPSLLRAHFQSARMARRLAALRCIEAIRMYAANHDGKLPPNLGAITEAPIPINPVTGRAFDYKLTGNTAVLEAPALEGQSPKDSARYEITIAK